MLVQALRFGKHVMNHDLHSYICITMDSCLEKLKMLYECRAMRAVWPKSIERVNLVEPSKEMQRAGQSLLDSTIHSCSCLPVSFIFDCAIDLLIFRLF